MDDFMKIKLKIFKIFQNKENLYRQRESLQKEFCNLIATNNQTSNTLKLETS